MSVIVVTQELIDLVNSVGDTDTGLLMSRVTAIYNGYASKATIRLQTLYTKVALIDLAMGEVRKMVNYRAANDVSRDLSDQFAHLLSMRKEAKEDIALELSGAASEDILGNGYTTGSEELLTDSSTSMVRPDGSYNANSLRFRGSPYQPSRGRR